MTWSRDDGQIESDVCPVYVCGITPKRMRRVSEPRPNGRMSP
jgi:hypothetical protein